MGEHYVKGLTAEAGVLGKREWLALAGLPLRHMRLEGGVGPAEREFGGSAHAHWCAELLHLDLFWQVVDLGLHR